ncbi:alpha-galactosidase [Cellulomonas pakistanensis]|uniref:Alpha-galactosidase n=1 Tax=Cellulomonas pakistanensis TaxID=992287 RepID=A0A919U3M7_9CELL|nr:alpha-galactosidase [Cellulomonas pakistanensis]GIG36476.1 alpha-galactosidase [Cellulomonas pakistanensis]
MTTTTSLPTRADRTDVTGDPILHLSADGVSLVLDLSGDRLPRVLHWGADLGDPGADELAALRATSIPPIASGVTDLPVPLSLLPEQSVGWLGTPGVTGHRDGRDFSTAFVVDEVRVEHGTDRDGAPVAHRVTVGATDAVAGLALVLEIEMLPDGLVRTRAAVTSTAGGVFTLGGVDLALPVPREADEILDFTGRHLRERSPQRHPFVAGTHLRESRRARSHDGTLLLLAGRAGFGYRSGEVWGVHVAWSGNTRTFAEQAMPTGVRVLGAGELLLAGEVRLAEGDTYATPWVYGSYGDGIDALSHRFHAYLRSRPQHPRTPRKSLINVWEAVYFDHDLPRLTALADAAAAAGVERYVLDDGWFKGRRSDDAGLGDWVVDEDVWPDGLGPLVDHVTGLGLEFGLWFEPEMVNPDSDLARAHPEWILQTGDRLPPEARHQQVLDLGHPGAWDHVFGQIDAVLSAYDIGYVKWDHNRDLIDAGHTATGAAGVHAQTLATYRLLDALRAKHPHVEFESCSGGGGRADLGILERTDRIWTSDCIDALERQVIEAGTGLLVPPEMLGSHIGSPHSHTTGRRHELGFRGATAFFGHLGIEWDLTSATDDERAGVARWVAAYAEHRDLLHHGRTVRADDPDPALRVHGVVSADRREAIIAVVQVATGVWAPPGRVRVPGLDPAATYEVRPLPPGDEVVPGHGDALPRWWSEGARLSGRTLGAVGVQVPNQFPERTVLLHLTAR